MANEFYWCNGFNGICTDFNACMHCPYANGAGGHIATSEEIIDWYADKSYQLDIDD